MTRILLILVLGVFLRFEGFSESTDTITLSKKERIDVFMTQIRQQVDSGNYSRVLPLLHSTIAMDTILPNDVAFFLGLSLHNYYKLPEAKKALVRYIQLTGETGRYYLPASKLITRIDQLSVGSDSTRCTVCEILGPLDVKDTCAACHGKKKFEQACKQCDGHSEEVCPVCLGSGVHVRYSNFNNTYTTCFRCAGSGKIICSYCAGKGHFEDLCKQCKGQGVVPRPRECTHKIHAKH